MRLLWMIAALACLGGFAAPALAGEVSEPTEVALTIYNGDLALIREVRDFTLTERTERLELGNVSGQLNPSTVHLRFLDGLEFELLEQNYDYDLVSRDKLLEKFVGELLVLVNDETRASEEVTLLSTAGGRVVQTARGQILLDPPGRVVLPKGAAEGLLLRPTLSWLLWPAGTGTHQGEISYLSSGLDWHADYVVVLNADDTAGDIEGWVTISNYSGTTYEDAKLKIVAGDVHRVQEQRRGRTAAAPAKAEARNGEGFVEEEFFEYHLYDLQRPTTIRNNQLKQIGLLTAAGVPFTKIFVFDGLNGGDVRVLVEFVNEEEAGMGMPLPKGTLRVFKADSEGDVQFVGEDRIDHTPRDEEVRLYLGDAFDIVGETVQTEYEDLHKGYRASYKITLKNRKRAEDVVVTVPVKVYGDFEILESNYDYELKDAFTAEFSVPVSVGEEAVLTFTFEHTWK